MKICVIAHYCKRIGGVETLSFEQAKRLAQLGHQVSIVSSKLNGDVSLEKVEGVRIHRVKALNLLDAYLGVPYPIFAPSLLKVLDEEIKAADVCLIHSFGFLSSMAAAWVCVRRRVPYILYQHNAFTPYRSRILHIVQRGNDLLAGRFILRNATEVLAISMYVRDFVRSLGRGEVEVLYGAADHLRFYPDGSRLANRSTLGLPPDKFIILATRRLVFKNGVDTLLASASLLKNNPWICFVVVGEGSERYLLEKYLVAQGLTNCVLVGSVSDEVLPDYYRAADMLVLPSRGEALLSRTFSKSPLRQCGSGLQPRRGVEQAQIVRTTRFHAHSLSFVNGLWESRILPSFLPQQT